MCLVTEYKKFLAQNEIKKRFVAKSFEFNGKKVQSVQVNGEKCLVSRDVYKATGYEEENGEKAIQNLVSKNYKLRFGDVNPSLNQ